MTDKEKISKSLKISIIEGSGAVAFGILLQGFVFTKIALEFNASDFELSIMFGIQLLSQISQLFVPFIINRIGERKKFAILFSGIAKVFWLVLLVAGILGIRSSGFFLFMVAMSFVSGAMAGNAWTGWMRTLVPERQMGSFFGLRNLIHSFAIMIYTFLYSQILNAEPNFKGVAIVIAIGLAGGFFSVFFLTKQYELGKVLPKQFNFKRIIKSDGNIKKLLIFGGIWNFSIMFSAPFFSIHQIKNLGVPFSFLGSLSIAMSIVNMAMYLFWGKMADRFGHKNVLMIGISFASFLPFMWFFMTPQTMNVLLWVDSIIAGVAWSAINLVMFTLPMLIGKEDTLEIVSIFATVNGIVGFMGSVFGGFIGSFVSPMRFELMGMEFMGVQIIFLIASFMRVASLFFLSRLELTSTVSMKTWMVSKIQGLGRLFFRDIFEPTPRIFLVYNKVEKQRIANSKEKGVL